MLQAPEDFNLDAIDRRLLDEFQRDLPLTPGPFAAIASDLGCGEAEIIGRLRRLSDAGAVSRVGAVLPPNRVGASTLAAMAVPQERLSEIATLVSAYPEVNHNYEREHCFNLWFVVTAANVEAVATLLAEIEARTGLVVLDLPLLEPFHIDLGFRLQWT